MATFYAPGERDSFKDLIMQRSVLDKIENIKDLLSSLSYVVFILNEKRQIVFANDLLLNKLNISDDLRVLGARPGEILACVHANRGPEGCGTSEYCRYCGAVNVILDAGKSKLPNTQEARIVVKRGNNEEQLDLEITASPFQFADSNYIVFSAQDITDKKRKELLERTFFHDIINLAGSLDGIMEMMDEMDHKDRDHFLKTAKRISNSLIDEIMAQQELVRAENNELNVHPVAYELNELIANSVSNITHHEVAKNKNLTFVPAKDDYGIITDKVLLNRIILNMLKNALEASKPEGGVTVSVNKIPKGFQINVHNQTVMPESVQKQVFQRSFSTKGAGRGIGTYSMKILGERYLKGKIGFRSSENEGTTFFLELPVKLKAE